MILQKEIRELAEKLQLPGNTITFPPNCSPQRAICASFCCFETTFLKWMTQRLKVELFMLTILICPSDRI